MQHYIDQLVEDIQNAQPKPSPDYKLLYPDHPALEYGLDYIVEWEMAERDTFANYFGMEVVAFPPVERLTKDQQKQVIDASLELWESNSMSVNLPEIAPMEKVYTFIVRMWAEYETHSVDEGGHLTFNTCDFNLENCFWGENCDCKDLDWDIAATINDPDALPF